jgi:hypothetical protein
MDGQRGFRVYFPEGMRSGQAQEVAALESLHRDLQSTLFLANLFDRCEDADRQEISESWIFGLRITLEGNDESLPHLQSLQKGSGLWPTNANGGGVSWKQDAMAQGQKGQGRLGVQFDLRHEQKIDTFIAQSRGGPRIDE